MYLTWLRTLCRKVHCSKIQKYSLENPANSQVNILLLPMLFFVALCHFLYFYLSRAKRSVRYQAWPRIMRNEQKLDEHVKLLFSFRQKKTTQRNLQLIITRITFSTHAKGRAFLGLKECDKSNVQMSQSSSSRLRLYVTSEIKLFPDVI